jgi:hypothetical protein
VNRPTSWPASVHQAIAPHTTCVVETGTHELYPKDRLPDFALVRIAPTAGRSRRQGTLPPAPAPRLTAMWDSGVARASAGLEGLLSPPHIWISGGLLADDTRRSYGSHGTGAETRRARVDPAGCIFRPHPQFRQLSLGVDEGASIAGCGGRASSSYPFPLQWYEGWRRWPRRLAQLPEFRIGGRRLAHDINENAPPAVPELRVAAPDYLAKDRAHAPRPLGWQ